MEQKYNAISLAHLIAYKNSDGAKLRTDTEMHTAYKNILGKLYSGEWKLNTDNDFSYNKMNGFGNKYNTKNEFANINGYKKELDRILFTFLGKPRKINYREYKEPEYIEDKVKIDTYYKLRKASQLTYVDYLAIVAKNKKDKYYQAAKESFKQIMNVKASTNDHENIKKTLNNSVNVYRGLLRAHSKSNKGILDKIPLIKSFRKYYKEEKALKEMEKEFTSKGATNLLNEMQKKAMNMDDFNKAFEKDLSNIEKCQEEWAKGKNDIAKVVDKYEKEKYKKNNFDAYVKEEAEKKAKAREEAEKKEMEINAKDLIIEEDRTLDLADKVDEKEEVEKINDTKEVENKEVSKEIVD